MLSSLDFDIKEHSAFFIRLCYQEKQCFLYWTLISRNAVLSLLDFDINKHSAFFIGHWYQETQPLLHFQIKNPSAFFIGL